MAQQQNVQRPSHPEAERQAAGTSTARGGEVNPEARHNQPVNETGLESIAPGGRTVNAEAPSPQADGDPRPLDAGRVETEQTPVGPTRR